MAWACTGCGRTYDEPPGSCRVCGSDDLVPRDGGGSGDRFSFAAVRSRLSDPGGSETSLVEYDPRVRLAFRVLVAVLALLVAVAVVAALLGG